MLKVIAACLLIGTFTTAAVAKDKAVSLRDKQQAACYDDAQRLCADAMPDEERVIACMKPKKALVSAECASYYGKE